MGSVTDKIIWSAAFLSAGACCFLGVDGCRDHFREAAEIRENIQNPRYKEALLNKNFQASLEGQAREQIGACGTVLQQRAFTKFMDVDASYGYTGPDTIFVGGVPLVRDFSQATQDADQSWRTYEDRISEEHNLGARKGCGLPILGMAALLVGAVATRKQKGVPDQRLNS
ncbi:MAG: hypothetical protein K9G62_05455 [Alphaproteobacteria bacterium]|nr:hypothetical protein [Alphaproteobacteria bacterium]